MCALRTRNVRGAVSEIRGPSLAHGASSGAASGLAQGGVRVARTYAEDVLLSRIRRDRELNGLLVEDLRVEHHRSNLQRARFVMLLRARITLSRPRRGPRYAWCLTLDERSDGRSASFAERAPGAKEPVGVEPMNA